jgi:hypothetical protein
VYQAKPGLTIGFHGCDQSLVKRLVRGETSLIQSNNSYDWLGTGIYFWENNSQRALGFAHELKKRQGKNSKIKNPAVVGAVIDMGFCMDLMDDAHIQLVTMSYENLLASSAAINEPVPVNRDVSGSNDLLLRDLDCAVINNLHIIRKGIGLPAYDSVRSAFIEGEKLYSNSGFHRKNHIQLCVRNPNCIKGYFLPRTTDDDWPLP